MKKREKEIKIRRKGQKKVMMKIVRVLAGLNIKEVSAASTYLSGVFFFDTQHLLGSPLAAQASKFGSCD